MFVYLVRTLQFSKKKKSGVRVTAKSLLKNKTICALQKFLKV